MTKTVNSMIDAKGSKRRLNESQRAIFAQEEYTKRKSVNPRITIIGVAEEFCIDKRIFQRAQFITKASPEAAFMVKEGKLTLVRAVRCVKQAAAVLEIKISNRTSEVEWGRIRKLAAVLLEPLCEDT